MNKTSQEKRVHHRFRIAVRVELCAADFPSFNLETRDMSDSGVFLVHDDPACLPSVGSRITMRVLDPLQGSAAPEVHGIVVRLDPDGIAIRFQPEPRPS